MRSGSYSRFKRIYFIGLTWWESCRTSWSIFPVEVCSVSLAIPNPAHEIQQQLWKKTISKSSLFRFYFSAYIKWQFNATEHAFSCPRADFGSFTAPLLQEGIRVEKFAVQMQCSYICLTAVKSRDCGEQKRWERCRGMLGMLSMILPYWTPCWISQFNHFKTVSLASSWQIGQPGQIYLTSISKALSDLP